MKSSSRLPSRRVTRRTFISTVAGAAGAVALAPACGVAAAQAAGRLRPNILFLNVDQLSCDSIGHHGCTHVKTPNIDRLGTRSVSFTQSYSTNPLCIPARGGWFTGRMTPENGLYDGGTMVEGMPTLGHCLRGQGYQTFHSG